MRFVFCIVFIATAIACAAQDDDMPDYRSKRDALLKIPEKDIQADVATFTMAGIDINNGKPPISSVPIKDYGDNFLTFDSGNIKVIITSGVFVPTKHKLQYADKYLIRIDTKPYFGMYSKVPKKTIQSVNVLIDGDTVAIPPAAYADLYEPGLSYTDHGETKTQDGVYYTVDRQNAYKRVYIYVLCNDGMGGYEVTWVIQDKKYYRRIVDFNILKN
jgi:hypothetical protein